MAIIKKFSPFQNLSNFSTFVDDDNPNSEYFKITEFKETFTGGKNGFLIEGCPELKESSEVKIELLDVEGNPIYFEPGDGIPEYYEGTSKLISVHVYEDTPIGLGKITILGELKQYKDSFGALVDIPNEWRGVYNLKWERTFQVNKNLSNETTVRFYKRPSVTITELIKPIFSKSIPTVTDTGHVHGFSITPFEGENITTWRAGTSYGLQKTSGSWDVDVDENIINISSLNYSPKIIEVLDSKQVLVDIPYTENNIVKNFESGSYSVTYTDFQNQVVGETSLTGSFAKIDISTLKTFVGDVARVKVFRKSRNAVGDFQFVQESKLESSELLRDITTTSDTELSYGRFDENNLTNYWVTSSDSHPTSINSDVLSQAVKIDYDENVGGVQRLITSESISVSSDVEYTLNFRTLLSGSLDDSGKTIKAFFSSSNFTQEFTTISGSAIYRARQNISENIISQNTGDAKLVFEVEGSDWYISNVSLRNAQESSFSPDEFTLIQDIPRKTASETFDFKFEFYDINNNYIPVDVTAVGVFDGGNDFPTSAKLLTFESDRNAFRFSSGSVQNPKGQQIQLKITQNNLTGSILFESSAFDVDGNYLNPSDYTQYPGLLTSVNPAGGLITINNFTGSRSDNLPTPFVGSVIYTASLENLQEFETVYRLEDGDNAPQLIVTSNANQFIYEPTTLSPKPQGQEITVRAQRKNLASLVTPIEVNSGSNKPALTYTETVNGIDTYLLNATTFSASFAENNFDEVTYSFTGSDVFGNSQSDEITISKVINFDGVSLVLSNESTTFPAKSTGVIIGGLASSKGDVQMFIGGTQITHDDIDGGRSKNTFDITSVSGNNVTPISTSPTTNEYGISAFQTNKDSGSITLDVEYLAGDSETSQSFQKVVSYTKAKNSVPNVEVSVTPSSQTINADSKGSGSVSPQAINVKALEGGTTRFTGFGDITYSGGLTGSISSNSITFTDTASDMTSDTETIQIDVNFTDSEGTSGTKTIEASISRVRTAQPNSNFTATPPAQTIDAKSTGVLIGTIQDVTISGFDGNTELTYNQSSTLGDGEYKITNVTGVNVSDTTPSDTTIGITSFSGDTATGTAAIAFKDTEGTLGSTTIKFTLSKSKKAVPNVEVSVSPTAQTIEANSVGSGSATPQTLTVKALEGGTSRFEEITNVSFTNGLDGDDSPSSNTVAFTSTASDMTSDTGTATITVSYQDSEGTTGTKDVIATVSRVRVASPNVEVFVTPQSQTINANSVGSGSDVPSSLRIDAREGGANRFTSFGVITFTGGLDGSGDNSTEIFTFSSDASDMTSDTGTVSIPVNFTDGEGTTGTTTIEATVSRVRVASPNVEVSVSPQSQTVTSNSDGSNTQTPSSLTVRAQEGGTNRLSSVSATGTNVDIGTITYSPSSGTPKNYATIPLSNVDDDNVSVSITVNYTDGEGTTGSKTILATISRAKKATPVIVASLNPQVQTVDSNSDFSTVTAPSTITLSINEGGTDYGYDSSGGIAVNKFRVTSVSGGTFNSSTGVITPTTPSGATGTSGTVTYSYTNSEGTTFTNKTIDFSVGVAVQGDDGAAGPGITFVGDCSDLESTFTWTSDENTRQVTKVGSSYYITKDAADGVAKSTTGCPGDTGWGTYFETMTSFASVATDVLFAQDVYANKTVNVGTSPNGTEPVIALNADAANSYANPYIGLNATSYNSNGIFLGYNDGVPKFSIKSATNSLLWNDSTLTINGTVNASAGTIGGWTIGASTLTGGSATLSSSGNVTLGSLNNVVRLSADDSNYRLWIGNATAASAPFRVTKAGVLTATGVTLSGAITITSGDTKDAIDDAASAASTAQDTADSKTTADAAATAANSADKTGGSVGGLNLTSTTMSIGTGEFNSSNTGFFVNSDGDFSLKNKLSFTASTSTLSVDGTVTATAGAIGGWNLTSTQLEGGTVDGGGDGTNTSTGMIINSSGFISAPEFNVSSAGVASFSTNAKLGGAKFDNVFAPSGTDLRIKKEAKILDGSSTAAFGDIFAIDTDGIFLEQPRFRETSGATVTGFSNRFSSLETSIDDELNDIASVTSYGCVLPGTKIITERGEVNVEDTNKGDIIKVYNFFTETWEWSPIDEIFKKKVNGWSHIKTKLGLELKCSNSHWLYHPSYPGHKIEVDELGIGGQLYVYHEGELKKDIITEIKKFDEEVEVYNYELERIHNYVSDGILSHNIAKLEFEVTLGHKYIKSKSVSISRGDLVKLNSSNELEKVTSSKDKSVVGILWEKSEVRYKSFGLPTIGGEPVSASTAPDNIVSSSLQDSFGNFLPNHETGSKEIWRVASVGDSVEYDSSGSYFTLQGFKMCNQGGDVIPGDLLCSSDTAGYLMKQPSEWVVTGFDGDSNPIYEERQSHCSYTVAKCMESSSWDSNGKMEDVYGYLYCG